MKHKKHNDYEDYRHAPWFFPRAAFVELKCEYRALEEKVNFSKGSFEKGDFSAEHSKSSAFPGNGPLTKSEGQASAASNSLQIPAELELRLEGADKIFTVVLGM